MLEKLTGKNFTLKNISLSKGENQIMKVLFLSCGPLLNSASRYRVHQYRKYLEAQGIRYIIKSYIPLSIYRKFYPRGIFFRLYKLMYSAYATFSRLAALRDIGKYDVIFVQETTGLRAYPFSEKLIFRKAHLLRKKVVFDFDDLLPTASLRILKSCDKVIAGNEFLKQKASVFNKNVTIIPTSIDLEKYEFKLPKREIEYPVVIGWMGSPYSFHYLNILWEVFKVLASKYDILIRIVGDQGKEIPGLKIEYEKWSLEKEVEQLHSFDIGVMPLTSDEKSRGKCGLKLLQYMAAGIPAVASPVGVNKKIISDGINGYLAVGKDEWIKKLEKLILNPDLREKFAKNGRLTVEKDFSLRENSKRLIKVLEEVYNSKR